jgi:hypothetical protein
MEDQTMPTLKQLRTEHEKDSDKQQKPAATPAPKAKSAAADATPAK